MGRAIFSRGAIAVDPASTGKGAMLAMNNQINAVGT